MRVKPSLREVKAIEIVKDIMASKRAMITIGEVMLEAGYPKSVSLKPERFTDSKAFEVFMAGIDERPIVNRWMDWALRSEDVRTALQAGENVMKLKGRFKDVIDVSLSKKREELFK